MKRCFWVLMGLAMLSLPLATGFASEDEPNWRRQARKALEAYSEPDEGMVRYVLYLEPKADEGRFQVELIVGRTIETDGVNQYGFGGQIERQTVQGWGYSKYVLEKGALDEPFSTMMAVPEGQPSVKTFVRVGGEPFLTRYNSKLPIVVYVPAGGEVRYRIWEAPEKETAVLPG